MPLRAGAPPLFPSDGWLPLTSAVVSWVIDKGETSGSCAGGPCRQQLQVVGKLLRLRSSYQ